MRETDEQLRKRIADAYGIWGAFLSVVMESSGEARPVFWQCVRCQKTRADEP